MGTVRGQRDNRCEGCAQRFFGYSPALAECHNPVAISSYQHASIVTDTTCVKPIEDGLKSTIGSREDLGCSRRFLISLWGCKCDRDPQAIARNDVPGRLLWAWREDVLSPWRDDSGERVWAPSLQHLPTVVVDKCIAVGQNALHCHDFAHVELEPLRNPVLLPFARENSALVSVHAAVRERVVRACTGDQPFRSCWVYPMLAQTHNLVVFTKLPDR